MDLSTDHILCYLREIAKEMANEDLTNTLDQTGKAVATVALSTLISTLLLGHPGIFVGAAAGSTIAYLNSELFKSIPEIIYKMTPLQREQFVSHARQTLMDIGGEVKLQNPNSRKEWLKKALE